MMNPLPGQINYHIAPNFRGQYKFRDFREVYNENFIHENFIHENV